jgi:hypothetical protein
MGRRARAPAEKQNAQERKKHSANRRYVAHFNLPSRTSRLDYIPS